MSVEKHQVGQLFPVIEASKNETGGGEGVEVVQYNPWIFNKVPALLRKVASRGSFAIHEKAWNAYPYCQKGLSASLIELQLSPRFQNPDYMGDNFFVRIETMHLNDRVTTANIDGYPATKLHCCTQSQT
ncbi:hypothetical protein M3Y98_00318200 [Aphelenchoides besseyi]|nr:hypothetical protein M3Y98_00318200 [Aphelenchoides besseyi]